MPHPDDEDLVPMRVPSDLHTLLQQCTDFSDSATVALNRYAALLARGELAGVFAALFCCPPENADPMSSYPQLVTDLAKLPDRTLGLRGRTTLADFPSELLPSAYCSNLLRNLALALREAHGQSGRSAFRADFPTRLLEALILNFREAMVTTALPPWWRFTAFLSAASPAAAAALASLFEHMGLGATEKYFLSCLSALPGSKALARLFGPAVQGHSVKLSSVIENSVFVRGLGSHSNDAAATQQLQQLMGFLKLVIPSLLRRLFEAGLRLFVDPAVVEAASPAELLNLCRSLAACLAALDDLARQQLRQTALPLLMRGSMDWLDSGPFRRDLGKIYVQLIQAASTRAVDPYPHRSAFSGKMENYNRKITRNWYRYRINCN